MTPNRPSSTHHTAVDTGSAGLRSVSAARTIASAAVAAVSSSTMLGPNVFHASSVPTGASYQRTNSDAITQAIPARAMSSPRRSRLRLFAASVAAASRDLLVDGGEQRLELGLIAGGVQRVAQQ